MPVRWPSIVPRGATPQDKVRQMREDWASRPLPAQRPRALTYCPEPSESVPSNSSSPWSSSKEVPKMQMLDQTQSPLCRLPGEIRQQIWANVLSQHFLHIARAHRRLLAIKCEEYDIQDDESYRHRCWGNTDVRHWPDSYMSWALHFYLDRDRTCSARPANLLPLLQTCRLIYSETVSALYEDNIFNMNHVDTIIALQKNILPQRFNQIRYVSFHWNFTLPPRASHPPWDFDTWLEACDVFSLLGGLEELKLYLYLYPDDFGVRDDDYGKRLLEPLKQIRSPKTFDVSLRPGSAVFNICYKDLERYHFRVYCQCGHLYRACLERVVAAHDLRE